MSKKVVITGANGYLGGIIKDCLKEKGFDCIDFVRTPLTENDYRFILGQDFQNEEIFDGVDWLIHTAYDFSANRTWKKTYQVNVTGSIKLFEAATKKNVKIIFISSISSFENSKSNYGKSKFMLEEYLKRLNKHNYIIRPGLIYGEKEGGIIKSLINISKFPVLPLIGGDKTAYLVNYSKLQTLIYDIVNLKHSHLSNQPIIAIDNKSKSFKKLLKSLGAKILIPIPWKLTWFCLKTIELLGIKIRPGSDSLVSLMNPNIDEPKCNLTKI